MEQCPHQPELLSHHPGDQEGQQEYTHRLQAQDLTEAVRAAVQDTPSLHLETPAACLTAIVHPHPIWPHQCRSGSQALSLRDLTSRMCPFHQQVPVMEPAHSRPCHLSITMWPVDAALPGAPRAGSFPPGSQAATRWLCTCTARLTRPLLPAS